RRGAGKARMSDLGAALRESIIDTADPGANELCDAFENALLDSGATDHPVEVVRLKSRVYRLSAGSDSCVRSFVLKRFDPWLGRRNEFVLGRWLPAIGFSDRCPQLFAVGADRRGRWVGQVDQGLCDRAGGRAHPDLECTGG